MPLDYRFFFYFCVIIIYYFFTLQKYSKSVLVWFKKNIYYKVLFHLLALFFVSISIANIKVMLILIIIYGPLFYTTLYLFYNYYDTIKKTSKIPYKFIKKSKT